MKKGCEMFSGHDQFSYDLTTSMADSNGTIYE